MAASFILLLLPILRRRRRNEPDSLVSRRPLQKRVVRVNASVVLVQGRWALESDLALEFFYVRFAQLVVLSCTQREEGEREREESRVSRTRARVHEKNSNIRQRERQHHHLSRGVVEKEGEQNERTVARGKEILPPNPPPNPLQPLPPLVGLPVSPQCAKDVD